MPTHMPRCAHCGRRLLATVVAAGGTVRTVWEDLVLSPVCLADGGHEPAPRAAARRSPAFRTGHGAG